MTKLAKSSLVAALILGTSASAITFDYSGEGGFTDEGGKTVVAGDSGIADTFAFNDDVNTSEVGGNIEGQPQLWSARANGAETADIYPMVSWSESNSGGEEPPAGGKSALGLVPYYNGINYNTTPYVATIVADGPKKPGGAMTHYNIIVNHAGLIVPTVEWEFKVWLEGESATKPDDPLWESGPMEFRFAEWETRNNATDANEPKTHIDTTKNPAVNCPGEFTGLMTDPWSAAALGTDGPINWTGYAANVSECDDAARYEGDTDRQQVGDSFFVGPQEYKVYMTGFYKCEDGDGIYHDLGVCTIQETFWQSELGHETAYVMLEIDEVHEEGCTHGYWKFENLKKKPPFALGDAWPSPYTPADRIQGTMGVTSGPDISLEEAVTMGGGGEINLARQATSGLLNAAQGMDYITDEEGVKDLYKCALGDSITPAECTALNVTFGDVEGIATILDDANNNGCPIDRHGNPIEE